VTTISTCEIVSDEELAEARDLWFDLAQHTNDDDPPYTHGVLGGLRAADIAPEAALAGSVDPPHPAGAADPSTKGKPSSSAGFS
jgi:hypothetical protein